MQTVTPLRYKVKEAAAVLGLEPQTVYLHVRAGVFSEMRPFGPGKGRRLYLRAGEVNAYAGLDPSHPDGGAKAAKAWRRANRVPEPKVSK